MAEVGEKRAFLHELPQNVRCAVVFPFGEDVVQLFPRTEESVHVQLLHGAVGTSADCSASRADVREQERLKLRSVSELETKWCRHFLRLTVWWPVCTQALESLHMQSCSSDVYRTVLPAESVGDINHAAYLLHAVVHVCSNIHQIDT